MSYRIRKYKLSDKSQVSKIHYETGFFGSSMKNILNDKSLWEKELNYYLDKEPESCFVLEDVKTNTVHGYILGAVRSNLLIEIVHRFTSYFRNLFAYFFVSQENKPFLKSRLLYPFNALVGYSNELNIKLPIHSVPVHFNLLPQSRGNSNGSNLLKQFEKYAKKSGVRAITAYSYYTKLNPNQNFMFKNNFKIYSEIKTSFWRYVIPNEEIKLRVYVKQL